MTEQIVPHDSGGPWLVSSKGIVLRSRNYRPLKFLPNNCGYLMTVLKCDRLGIKPFGCVLHRTVARHFSTIPKGYGVSFKNGNKRDCRFENLEIIPMSEIRSRSGRNHHKMSLEQRNEARRLHKCGVSRRELAARYGVNAIAIRNMLERPDSNPKYSNAQIIQMRKDYHSIGAAECCKVYKISMNNLRKIMFGLNYAWVPEGIIEPLDACMAYWTDNQVLRIRCEARAGKNTSQIAKEWNVCSTTVRKMLLGQTYKHVDNPLELSELPTAYRHSRDDVKRIKELLFEGLAVPEVARTVGESTNYVRKIKHNLIKVWVDVEPRL